MQSLNESERMIMNFATKTGKINSNQVIALVDTITTNQGAYKALNRLVEKQFLTKVKEGKVVYYTLIQHVF